MAWSGILWHTLAYSCILWHTLAYSGIQWHTLAHSGILLHTMAYSCILLHTLACSGILLHNQCIILTVDGAYHCPVGSIWLFFYTIQCNVWKILKKLGIIHFAQNIHFWIMNHFTRIYFVILSTLYRICSGQISRLDFKFGRSMKACCREPS